LVLGPTGHRARSESRTAESHFSGRRSRAPPSRCVSSAALPAVWGRTGVVSRLSDLSR
jgi:hypothetical protein